jgi:hypothetical protein
MKLVLGLGRWQRIDAFVQEEDGDFDEAAGSAAWGVLRRAARGF